MAYKVSQMPAFKFTVESEESFVIKTLDKETGDYRFYQRINGIDFDQI